MMGRTNQSNAASSATFMAGNGNVGGRDDDDDSGVEEGGASLISGKDSSHLGTTGVQSSSDGKTGGSGEDGGAASIRKQLSKQESKNVLVLRLVVLLVLLAAAAVISVVVYQITAQGEKEEFKSQYEGAAGKVIESFEDIMMKMGSVSGLASAITSYGEDHSGDADWPFITMNNFQQKATHALHLSGALLVSMNLFVQKDDFEAWDEYVGQPEHTTWIDDAIEYQEELGINNFESEVSIERSNLTDRLVDPMHYSDEDGEFILEDPGQNLYLPQWQTSPYLQEGVVNTNVLRDDDSRDIGLHVWDSGTAVLGGYLSAPPGTSSHPDPTTARLAALRSIKEGLEVPYLGDPVAYLYVPVFDVFGAQRKVVGVLTTLVHWKSYLMRILPESSRGVIVVVEYECGDGFIHDHAYEADADQEDDSDHDDHDDEADAGQDDHSDHDDHDDEADAGQDDHSDHDDEGRDQDAGHDHRRTATSSRERDLITFTLIGPDADATFSSNTTSDEALDFGEDNVSQTEGGNSSNLTTVDDHGHDFESAHNDTQDEEEHEDSHHEDEEEHEDSHHEDEDEHDHPVDEATAAVHNDYDDHSDPTGEDPHLFSESHGSLFTYVLNGAEASVVGRGDRHDPKFDKWVREGHVLQDTVLDDGTASGIKVDQRCGYMVRVYPSQEFYDTYNTSEPLTITLIIVAVFIFAILVFFLYDRLVEHRQTKILRKATQSAAIVSSLFPKNVTDRLLQEGDDGTKQRGTKTRMKGFIEGETDENDATAAPIADLFPHCTVFFSDISGFTAWSSTREPTQVFVLLQTLYQAFDALAKRRRVFKVETIGDCYMAVTGLPEPQEQHALIMVRFAADCLQKMNEITHKLESTLGPDTGELSMRFGLHSGPVTAGVLRGDRARFQLFGDTVNTASRMESTGERGKIQVSEATANLIREAGKEKWLTSRADPIRAKGKGVMRTFFANPKSKQSTASVSSSTQASSAKTSEIASEIDSVGLKLAPAKARLVDWISQLLLQDIKKIVYARKNVKIKSSKTAPSFVPSEGATCLDEVKEFIQMPKFDAKLAHQNGQYKQIQIDNVVACELTEYVAAIASMYRSNPFHNFDHACHVTMSVNKLLTRIVSPEHFQEGSTNKNNLALQIHDYTYGINSDPLAMFAMTFSALIHDVDHQGISNMQLAVENPDMADKYDKKSIAEQNSLDLAWDLLMEERFGNLRHCLFASKAELLRFRQLIVNVVLATDIFDKELNDLRKNRWKQAFSGEQVEEQSTSDHKDLRATIVIEHIIQASDVSHTMQHWHVYQKWNKCLFKEMYAAYTEGRLAKDPATFWYKGEIGFFDNYIIPLAKKLKDCAVFGVSSDEYLSYAVQNRSEWEERGQEIVAAMVKEVTAESRNANATSEQSSATIMV